MITVGVLMLAYVLFGGMVATTWVQIIKAVLLVFASILMVILVWSRTDSSATSSAMSSAMRKSRPASPR